MGVLGTGCWNSWEGSVNCQLGIWDEGSLWDEGVSTLVTRA